MMRNPTSAGWWLAWDPMEDEFYAIRLREENSHKGPYGGRHGDQWRAMYNDKDVVPGDDMRLFRVEFPALKHIGCNAKELAWARRLHECGDIETIADIALENRR